MVVIQGSSDLHSTLHQFGVNPLVSWPLATSQVKGWTNLVDLHHWAQKAKCSSQKSTESGPSKLVGSLSKLIGNGGKRRGGGLFYWRNALGPQGRPRSSLGPSPQEYDTKLVHCSWPCLNAYKVTLTVESV